jgi:dTDP-glucose pyrophosphorylase
MIKYVLSNIHTNDDDQIFIIYNKDFLQYYTFIKKIHEINPKIICIPTLPTKGAAETIYNGIKYILDNNLPHFNKTLCCDCDTFYTADIVSLFRNCHNNAVFFTVNTEPTPIYSYICINSCNNITQIAEKHKISDNANTGAYGFNSIYELYEACEYVLKTGITFNGEPYTSCVIDTMIKQGQLFEGIELDAAQVFSLGTPEAVENYKKSAYCFMFDLDGTIAHTDNIYYQVWQQIVPELTPELFNNFIQGNTDAHVNDVLCANKYQQDELMALKDSLFLHNLQQINEVKGIREFMNRIKTDGHHICVVTNSNRDVAINILKHLNY